jgi:hypothetical protein
MGGGTPGPGGMMSPAPGQNTDSSMGYNMTLNGSEYNSPQVITMATLFGASHVAPGIFGWGRSWFLCEIWVGVVGGTMGEELFDFL